MELLLVREDLRLVASTIENFFGWHSALRFTRSYKDTEIKLIAERLTPEYDSEIDIKLLDALLYQYEERIENLEFWDITSRDIDYELGSTESHIWLTLSYDPLPS